MKTKACLTILPTFLLAATLLKGATAQQARITIVERNAASSVQAGAQPSVVRKQVPGEPDHEAYRFSQTVHVGSPATEVVRVAFHQPTTLKSIEASNDFHVASSSCQMGRTYNEGDSCDVSVTLDPKGPGKRAGLLKFTSNESATPDVVGLQGTTMGAVLSFIPAQINTVLQTMPGGKPLLYSSWDIATDQGDNLYISDATSSAASGSGKIYFIDGSLALTTLVGGGAQSVDKFGDIVSNANVDLNNPAGIAVDSFLDLYTAEYGTNSFDMTSRGNTRSIAGLGGTNAWGCNTPCTALGTALFSPWWVNVDDQQNIFLTDNSGFYEIPWVPSNGTFKLNTIYNGNVNQGTPFGLDSSDNLYGLETTVSQCMIDGVTPASYFQWDAVGSGICGLAANNVRSQNAEIGNYISGYAFDAAGDMYFSDQKNNVIRRVDNYNGLIRTVAGNTTYAGNYFGDGGPATNAGLDIPNGVAVDSLGNVYAEQTDPNFTTAPAGLVRMVGPQGMLQYPTMLVGQTSAVETILLTNTGNDNLSVSNVLWGGANPGDFVEDPATSSCAWGSALASGRSCQYGFSCKPTAAGTRSATITFVDNTATFQNVINLSCYAISAPVATTVAIAPPANGAVFIAGSTVQTAATVANNITTPITQPTGTVSMQITNTATSVVVAKFNLIKLHPYATLSKSYILNQSYTNAAPGNYQITATYSGDSLDAAGSATPVNFSVVQVTPTVTITTPANNSQTLPGNVTASITVSNFGLTPTAPSPTGSLTVTLTNTGTSAKQTFNPTMPAGSNGKTITSVPLGNLAVGTYTISAAYSGDTADTAATSATNNFSVVQVTPSVTITAPVGGSQNLPGNLTATVKVSNVGQLPTAPSPTGTLSLVLTNTGTSAQTNIGPVTMPAGSAGVTTTSNIALGSLAVGNYSLAATYNGDTDDKSANATAITFSVVQIQPTIIITSPQATTYSYVASLTYSAQLSNANLTPADPSAPTGTVTFTLTNVGTNGQTTFGPYTLGAGSNNVVNISVPSQQTPPAGATYTLQASYSGDTDDKPATSAPLQFVMGSAPSVRTATSTVLSAGANPAPVGKTVQFNATVRANMSATPTGWVTLWEGGKPLTSAPLNGGKASLNLTSLSAGIHSILATYSGDASNEASASETLKQVVAQEPNEPAHGPENSEDNP